MDGKLILAIILLLAPLITATPLDANSNTVKVDVSNVLEIESESINYRVTEVEASLSWIPAETYRQEVLSLNTEPETERLDEEAVFRWRSPDEKELEMKLTGTVTTKADYYPVTTHVDFPIRNVDSSLSQYLGEKDIIDINEEIESKAAELAEGKTDLYDVVFTLAQWVNENINYELDTVTSEASQKSSWVLENKRGVCDEMTSLYISMLRSLGVPARFAYGQAYTNAYIEREWGGHGWAEVWFPTHGWVPIDPTYGQYGYLDPGHVKMGHSEDARKPSLKYSILSRDAGISSGFLNVKAQAISENTPMDPGVELEANAYFAETGLDSYNLVTATIANTDNKYKPVTIRALTPEEIEVESPEKYILLKPGETRKVRWITKTEGLREKYIYTFSMNIETNRGAEAETVYKSQASAKEYEKAFFEELTRAGDDDKPYNRYVNLGCEASRDKLYTGESTKVTCTIYNDGGKDISGVEVCMEECETTDLESKDYKVFSFNTSYEEPGVKNVIVTAENHIMSKTSYTRVNVIDGADVGIQLSAPDTTDFGKDIHVMFNLTPESKSVPQNVRAELSSKGGSQDWSIGSLEGPQKFDVKVNTNNFGFTNKFTLNVWYEDELGKEYHESREVVVEIAPLTFWDQIRALVNAAGWKVYAVFT